MNNFISIVKHFNLVIYTDENAIKYIDTKSNSRIKVVIKPIEDFYQYEKKDLWIKNHEKNIYLNGMVHWKVNMLWSEKIWFVKETIERKYFETDFYGWCDIGYFRNRTNDLHTINLENWCNYNTSNVLEKNKNKILYACTNNDYQFLNWLHQLINNKSKTGLPIKPIPPTQQSFAGGFFIIHKDKIGWWTETYDSLLKKYFENNYLVKDDQIILANCILKSNADIYLILKNKYLTFSKKNIYFFILKKFFFYFIFSFFMTFC
jgi:hypothetical protein